MLLGIYEPQEDMDVTFLPKTANAYYWSYMVISFFILLNALLAIIVDAYAACKSEADGQAEVDPLTNYFKKMFKKIGQPSLDVDISDRVLAIALTDLYENINTQKNANLPGMHVRVKVPHVHDDGSSELHPAGELAMLMGENLDGTLHVRYVSDNTDADVAVKNVEAAQMKQVRLPTALVEKIMVADIASMSTKTRFYMVQPDPDKKKPALLDQVSLLLALKILAPTMHMRIAMALSINILKRYGHNADLDGDGVISPKEWDALEEVLHLQEQEDLRNPMRSQNSFISMILA